jgi:potassium efflux system protein
MQRILKYFLLIVTVISTFSQGSIAQERKKKPRYSRDSERKSRRSRDSVLQALNKSDTSINNLTQKIEQYTTTFNQINNSLAEGLDTTEIGQRLPGMVKRLDKIHAQANTKKSSTLRYLFVLRDNLDHIQNDFDGWQSDLDDISTKLIQNQHDLARFTSDSLLKKAPADSVLKKNFFIQRRKLSKLWHRTDSINRSGLLKVNLLQDKVAVAYTGILDENDQIDSKIKRFVDVAVSGEFGNIWEAAPQYNNFAAALNGTINLNNTQLYYFLKNGTATHLVDLLFFTILIILFYTWKKSIRENALNENFVNHTDYIYQKPLISALLITTAIAPYFYDHPPVAFLEAVFLISLALVLVLAKEKFPKSAFNFLFQLYWITIICCLSNLLIQITNIDRFGILLLSVFSIILAFRFYKKVKEEADGHLPYTIPALKIFIGMQALSLILNITGRFSLAKILTITAVFNLWMLVSLYFIVQIIIQGLFLMFHNKKDENSFISLVDYNNIQKKFLNILTVLAGLLWLFFLFQNLNIDDWMRDYLNDVLNQPRFIGGPGGASFTLYGFVLFIIVIWLSSLLSKIISYFFDVSAQHASDLSAEKKKNRASTLLIRVAVFSVGFLLAVAASGFPLDKLTIIFSAFGVGIGFGLQNIVNNLVSGLILAFEKPIQIGDVIEVDNRSGTIKEIGIRSSKLATSDGAEVIIPNGDLISHHVVNWTLSNSNRRIELLVNTAYGTDIQKVKDLLKGILANREDIMSQPGPSVFLHNVTESSVDFRIFFWAADISNFLELKSAVLADIYDAFRKEGIEMPSGDKDINLHFPEEMPTISINSKLTEKENGDANKASPDPAQ